MTTLQIQTPVKLPKVLKDELDKALRRDSRNDYVMHILSRQTGEVATELRKPGMLLQVAAAIESCEYEEEFSRISGKDALEDMANNPTHEYKFGTSDLRYRVRGSEIQYLNPIFGNPEWRKNNNSLDWFFGKTAVRVK